MARRGT